jgi:uncharacterized protein YegP (UPF0339 family)
MRKRLSRIALALVLVGAVASAGLHRAAAQDKKDKDKAKDKGKEPAAAVFELYKDNADEFRFRLKGGDGTLLATSGKGYKTKADCQKVIDAIKRDAAKAKVEDMAK